MRATYDEIVSVLNAHFHLVKGEEKDYFFDDAKRVVATIDENLITMFYDFPKCSSKLWTNIGKVAVAFARNFNVNGHICDVLCIDGLNGTCNDLTMKKNCTIYATNNSEISYRLLDDDKDSIRIKKILKEFESSIISGVAIKPLFNIDDIQLLDDRDGYKLGNCGNILVINGFASFDINGALKFDKVVVSPIDSNVIDLKNIYPRLNCKEVYSLYRRENGYYSFGYRTASLAEKRKSTVGVDSVHIITDDTLSTLDAIYKNGDQSLNAKRLQMIYMLNILLNDKRKSTDYVCSHYDFNVRKCDLTRQRVKR